jgi:hypothetical protein
MPLTITSFTGGKLGAPLWLPGQSAEIPELSPSSSGSGGCGLRGMMPGSLPDVRKRRIITCNSWQLNGANYQIVNESWWCKE